MAKGSSYNRLFLTVLKSLFQAAIHFFNSFLLSALLKVVKTLGHLLTNLLWGLEVSHELLLIDTILSVQKGLQSIWI